MQIALTLLVYPSLIYQAPVGLNKANELTFLYFFPFIPQLFLLLCMFWTLSFSHVPLSLSLPFSSLTGYFSNDFLLRFYTRECSQWHCFPQKAFLKWCTSTHCLQVVHTASTHAQILSLTHSLTHKHTLETAELWMKRYCNLNLYSTSPLWVQPMNYPLK